jgi:hypothetical protein
MLPSPEFIPLAADSTGPLHGFIDEITRTDRFVHLIGWARNRSAATPASHVIVSAAGKAIGFARPCLPRPDVARAFGDSAGNFGYSIELPLATVARAMSRSFTVLARDEQGRHATLEWSESALASFATLAPPPAPPRISAFHFFRRRFKIVRAAARHPVSADRAC